MIQPIKHPAPLAALALLAALATTTAALARPVSYTAPPDSSKLRRTADPGYARADALCATCHSRDYITTQPPKKGKEFWTAEVTKMVNVYGAQIPEPDRGVIADYLAATY